MLRIALKRLRLPTYVAAMASLSPCAVFGTQAAAASASPTLLILSGVVWDGFSGEPLSGASVTIDGFGEATVTGAAGRYRIETRQRALDHLTGVQGFLAGYLPEERFDVLGCTWIVTRVDEDPSCEVTLDFWLRPVALGEAGPSKCPVCGEVLTDSDDFGLAGAIVHVEGTEIRAISDESGRYSLSGAPAGLRRLEILSPGMITERRLAVIQCSEPGAPVTMSFRVRPAVIS
jgi:hypothetical protein